jgi:hypothetical protein
MKKMYPFTREEDFFVDRRSLSWIFEPPPPLVTKTVTENNPLPLLILNGATTPKKYCVSDLQQSNRTRSQCQVKLFARIQLFLFRRAISPRLDSATSPSVAGSGTAATV